MKTYILFCLFLLSLLNFKTAFGQQFQANLFSTDTYPKASDTVIVVERNQHRPIGKGHLNPFFLDFGFFGLSKYGSHTNFQFEEKYGFTSHYIGTQFRIGNSWYLVRGRFRGILRLTWFRLGVVGGDGIISIAAPVHLGFGHNFKVSDNFSMDLTISGGLLIKGILDPELDYGVAPEIKFNIKNLVIGIEYSLKRDFESNSNSYHYYSFGLGFKL